MSKFIIVFLFLSHSLTAAIFHAVDTTQPLFCQFSAKHHNRVLVDQGRVKKIIFPEEHLFVRMEETSGQVFIQAKHFLPEPMLISVVTQEGEIQDIELTFADCPAEVVILQSPHHEEINCLNEEPIYCCQNHSLDSLIETLLSGEIPSGYISIPFTRCVMKPKLGISMKLIARLQNG